MTSVISGRRVRSCSQRSDHLRLERRGDRREYAEERPELHALKQNPMVALPMDTEVRLLYHDGMVRVVVTPTWAKLIVFETTLPSAVEELIQLRAERQRA
ncbi:hypothetical protein [Kribbella voronezhensis]|uniref:hypothetical protein n=1 Tax=Kribbella voronezhensis TaxID=2512212 RepID=UPI00192DC96D|nr:hypothetical protein [Kribbella voronezhensis]